jgi:hypothetical protein
MMGRIEDRNFEYIPESESSKPGYLEKRMKLYKKMVENEKRNSTIHSVEKTDNDKRNHGQVSSEPDDSVQGRKLAVIRGKG